MQRDTADLLAIMVLLEESFCTFIASAIAPWSNEHSWRETEHKALLVLKFVATILKPMYPDGNFEPICSSLHEAVLSKNSHLVCTAIQDLFKLNPMCPGITSKKSLELQSLLDTMKLHMHHAHTFVQTFVHNTAFADFQERYNTVKVVQTILHSFEEVLEQPWLHSNGCGMAIQVKAVLHGLNQLQSCQSLLSWFVWLRDTKVLELQNSFLETIEQCSERGVLWALEREHKLPILQSRKTIGRLLKSFLKAGLARNGNMRTLNIQYQNVLGWLGLWWAYNTKRPDTADNFASTNLLTNGHISTLEYKLCIKDQLEQLHHIVKAIIVLCQTAPEREFMALQDLGQKIKDTIDSSARVSAGVQTCFNNQKRLLLQDDDVKKQLSGVQRKHDVTPPSEAQLIAEQEKLLQELAKQQEKIQAQIIAADQQLQKLDAEQKVAEDKLEQLQMEQDEATKELEQVTAKHNVQLHGLQEKFKLFLERHSTKFIASKDWVELVDNHSHIIQTLQGLLQHKGASNASGLSVERALSSRLGSLLATMNAGAILNSELSLLWSALFFSPLPATATNALQLYHINLVSTKSVPTLLENNFNNSAYIIYFLFSSEANANPVSLLVLDTRQASQFGLKLSHFYDLVSSTHEKWVSKFVEMLRTEFYTVELEQESLPTITTEGLTTQERGVLSAGIAFASVAFSTEQRDMPIDVNVDLIVAASLASRKELCSVAVSQIRTDDEVIATLQKHWTCINDIVFGEDIKHPVQARQLLDTLNQYLTEHYSVFHIETVNTALAQSLQKYRFNNAFDCHRALVAVRNLKKSTSFTVLSLIESQIKTSIRHTEANTFELYNKINTNIGKIIEVFLRFTLRQPKSEHDNIATFTPPTIVLCERMVNELMSSVRATPDRVQV